MENATSSINANNTSINNSESTSIKSSDGSVDVSSVDSGGLQSVHHIAIICSDYQKSKIFYTEILGLKIVREVYREARKSYKLDLAIGDHYVIELFSFPDPPPRPSKPESCGLRHLAFVVSDVAKSKSEFEKKGLTVEPIRVDEFTDRSFTFFADPDGLPIELYQGM